LNKFIGNCNHLEDWDTLIKTLSVNDGISITPDPIKWKLDTPGYTEIYKNWNDAKFNTQAIEWINYYPGVHYSNDVTLKLSNYLKMIPLRSWISRINPGYFAPWHWDVDDNELEYLKKGYPKRISCFIEKPVHGHIFIVEDEYLFNQEQGTIYQWADYKNWHSGINAGLTPKYMLHLLAIDSSNL